MALQSQLFAGDPKLEAAAVSDPDHIIPGARGEHVRKIQLALIKLDGTAIDADGIYGPKTAAAVAAFKRKRGILNFQGQIDNIVGIKTMAALDAGMLTRKKETTTDTECLAQSPAGGCSIVDLGLSTDDTDVVTAPAVGAPAKDGSGGDGERQDPDLTTVALAVVLLGQVRTVIRAANFRCLSADPFVTNQKLTRPTGPFQATATRSLELLSTVFSLNKFRNPRPPFENIKRVYRNMDVALNRSFETAPLIAPTLFVPNTFVKMEKKAAAYTSAGGAFKTAKVTLQGLGVPADRIYICNNFFRFSTDLDRINALVHELAHFVSGQPIRIDDIVKKGHMLEAAAKPAFDRLRPEEKVRSAEHYAFFAMVAGFQQLLSTTP
jgi:peptidoglycan hydrolase-like protein with peptidoglycan-binding domain